jgi:hypothetical protein
VARGVVSIFEEVKGCYRLFFGMIVGVWCIRGPDVIRREIRREIDIDDTGT